MITIGCRLSAAIVVLAVMMMMGPAVRNARAQSADGDSILNARCAACHERLAEGGLARISQMRKTPEGWDMTLVRMMLIHGVEITAEERRALVKYLADTRGLAPAETRDWRFILERRPNVVETAASDNLGQMCARCHSFARVAIQRRDTGEWLKLSNFHLGQWPTIEYQALGRDRNWWEIASTEVPKELGKLYPLETAAWTMWQNHETADLSGTWRSAGRMTGGASYDGMVTITRTGPDSYNVHIAESYTDGSKLQADGQAILYTGYEWRSRLTAGDLVALEVYALSEDGNAMSGRWFLDGNDAIGGDGRAVRVRPGYAEIMAVYPDHLRSGQTAEVAIHGTGLDGDVSLGDGVEIVEVKSRSPETVVVVAKAAAEAASGARAIGVGTTTAPGLLTVYGQVDSVRVEPAEAIARVGGGGGPLPAVPAQFEAVGYLDGPDGTAGTDDDVRIGVMPASWSVSNFTEVAAAMKDAKFAGTISANGLFMPAAAGPNPNRPFGTNNAGDLTVTASVDDGGRQLESNAHLVVTVQRWNDPPIR